MMTSDIEASFEHMRQNLGMPFEQRLLGTNREGGGGPVGNDDADPQASPTMTKEKCGPDLGLTLSEIYDQYLGDPTRKRSARTMLAHHTTRKIVEDVLDGSTPIGSITRDACRRLLEILRWLPVNYGKKYGDITVEAAAALAKADGYIRTINPTNLNAYMARFATMMNWAVTEEHLERNPARGLQIAETVHPQDRRKPFETWQLQRIFSAPIYTGCKDEQTGYASPGSVVASGARYWVPLVGLLTGMRLNEICQLDVSDIRILDGVACFVVAEESLNGARDKSLKTKTSARVVPVHPTLHSVGFMSFVDRKRTAGAAKLFDDLPPGAKGFRSIAFSRWFSRFLVSAGAKAPLTCYHSFRHGFRDAARNARIDRDIALTLGGWITGGSQSEAADRYGVGYRPSVLFEAISLIKYPELDLSAILHVASPAGMID
jgi:integrase